MPVLAAAVDAAATEILRAARARAALELPHQIRDAAALMQFLQGRALFAQVPVPGIALGDVTAGLLRWAEHQDQLNGAVLSASERDAAAPAGEGGYL